MKNSLKMIATFLLAGAGAYSGALLHDHFKAEPSASTPPTRQLPGRLTSAVAATAAPVDFTEAAESSISTVVHVTTRGTAVNQSGYVDPFGFFWGQPNPSRRNVELGAGSGVIISSDGYIVTNNHVIENANDVSVTLFNNRTYAAEVIGRDASTDLALIKIDAKGLPAAEMGNSDAVKIGEWVLAVGNPFNLTSTVTAGIVSAKSRNINILPEQKMPIESFIQTDAAVNPGNSGGALVNVSGQLIGINAAIASTTGSFSGYSFAIPSNMVRKVVDDLREFGVVQRGFIGVSIRDLDENLIREKDLNTGKGVYIAGLTEGGAAEKSGLKVGDIITHINGNEVGTSPELQENVGRYRPGDKINVTVLRNDEERNIPVTLRNKDGNTEMVTHTSSDLLGAEMKELSSAELRKMGLESGVQISELGPGKLRSSGIREGFIITSIDNKSIRKVSEVTDYLKSKSGGVLIEGVYPNGMRAYYGFGM